MIMENLKEIDENIFQKKWAIFETTVPYLKELFHFIAQTQGIVCLYQARENKENPDNYTYYRNG